MKSHSRSFSNESSEPIGPCYVCLTQRQKMIRYFRKPFCLKCIYIYRQFRAKVDIPRCAGNYLLALADPFQVVLQCSIMFNMFFSDTCDHNNIQQCKGCRAIAVMAAVPVCKQPYLPPDDPLNLLVEQAIQNRPPNKPKLVLANEVSLSSQFTLTVWIG